MGYKSLVDYNTCSVYSLLNFYSTHKEYNFYWSIEYDVLFNGKWNILLDDCDKNLANYDFLSCHIEKYGPKNNEWLWWNKSNDLNGKCENMIKSFNVICRYQNNTLPFLNEALKKERVSHSEIMVSTLLYENGFKLGDFGGSGEFVPDGYDNKYYLKYAGLNNGTVRWRPGFGKDYLDLKEWQNKLFHPFKPI